MPYPTPRTLTARLSRARRIRAPRRFPTHEDAAVHISCAPELWAELSTNDGPAGSACRAHDKVKGATYAHVGRWSWWGHRAK